MWWINLYKLQYSDLSEHVQEPATVYAAQIFYSWRINIWHFQWKLNFLSFVYGYNYLADRLSSNTNIDCLEKCHCNVENIGFYHYLYKNAKTFTRKQILKVQCPTPPFLRNPVFHEVSPTIAMFRNIKWRSTYNLILTSCKLNKTTWLNLNIVTPWNEPHFWKALNITIVVES